ncbi:MAG: thiosulfate/3-mercaptopyruvate sulfurtransferase [Chloroflexota bacterium]|nr:thiosulfate/3-mercaptopyruvate sulfurtransferase [Chloroflexota bacterium]
MTKQIAPLETPPGPLVSGDWLQANPDEQRVVVLDVRGRHPSSALAHAKRAEYAEAHIPGAVFVDWEHDFVDVADPVPYQIASSDVFAARAAALGIGDGDLIVTYDDYYGIFAARVAWSFRFYGAEARVLDGGWRTWVDEGRPTGAPVTQRQGAVFTPRARTALRRSLDEVEVASAGGVTLVDARPRHLFLGEPGAAGTGHIPGARSLPYQELVDGATGLFATPAAIARLLRDAGIDPARPPRELIATCGTGVSATVALIALELAGVHGAGVYDGSFSEWSANPARPIEYGAAG